MQKGIVFIAPLGARNKKANIFDEIVSLCPENDYSSVLYLTPAIFSQTEARRQFFSYLKTIHKKKVYIPFQSFTLTNFCTNLYDTFYPSPISLPQGEGGRVIISDRIEPLILCEIIGEKNIGYARLLSDLLSKIRHYIPDKELSQIKDEFKSLIFEEKTMRRAVKALEVLELYEKELEGKRLITLEGAIKNSIVLIKEHMNQSTEHRPVLSEAEGTQNADREKNIPLIKYEILILDGFFDPTPLELEVIKTLLEQSEKAFVLVEENAEFLNFFESKEQRFEIRRLKPSYHRDSAGYYAYPSMEEEVEGIAKSVKSLILEGTSPREIAVSFPALSKYLSMLRRIFQKHGIPISIAEYDLSNTKPFAAIEDMIASLENDYPRNEFLSFLTSPHSPGIPEILKKQAVSFSYIAGLVKGRQAWLSIKEILLNSTEEDISPDMGRLIEVFQQEIKKIINILETLKQKKNLSVFADELEGVLNKLGFFDSLEESSSALYGSDASLKITNSLSELKHFAEIYGPDETSVSKIVTTENENPPSPLFSKGGKGGFVIDDAGFYLRHLLKGLKGSAENINGVRVVPFEFAAGLEFRALFLGGMVEGEFPSRPGIDPILPEKVKETLGLPFLEYYMDRQKRYFKKLLHVSSDEPYFSYPSADGDKIFLPSPFLDWETTLNPPVLNISTEEEILVSNGASQQRDFSETLLDGKLPRDKEVKGFLKKILGSRIFFSVTDIDAYRQCPLRFYIERVLCLEVEKPPKFEVEAKLWGKLAHKTMESLYKDGAIELQDIDKKIFEGLESSLKQFPIGNFWSKVAREIFQRLLPLLKEQEAGIRMQGFSPYKVEKTIKANVNNLNLKGKIDRVDRRTQNTENPPLPPFVKGGQGGILGEKSSQQDMVILLDYKTGSIDKDSLQLPLYAAMWQGENLETVEKVGFYSLKDGRVDWYPKRLNMDEFIQEALSNAGEIVQKIKKGIFTPTPFKEEDCRYCYHRALCKK